MSIFRNGIKVGKHDIRTGLSKERGQGILRKVGILPDDKGRDNFKKDGMGDVQTIRTIVGMGEGFTMPVNFRCTFNNPVGIDQEVLSTGGPPPSGPPGKSGTNGSKVKFGGLDWQTHIMNKSTTNEFKKLYDAAQAAASTTYKISKDDAGRKRELQKMNLYCSKVSIPEKSINTTLIRQYGAPFPYPQGVQYGTISTTFYCDGTMHIKNYFDAWQKMIYNDLTGNFNFYDEYVAEFDVFTRTTIASNTTVDKPKEDEEPGWADKISGVIKEGTKAFNDATGVDGPRDGKQVGENKIPKVDFRRNYGVRIFKCWPQLVSNIDLAHDGGGNIATFSVTWQYEKWNPFKMGNVGNRSTINLAIGEFRNEKDGFPFIEDLPPELSGPLSSAIGQGINTGPMSKLSNLLG